MHLTLYDCQRGSPDRALTEVELAVLAVGWGQLPWWGVLLPLPILLQAGQLAWQGPVFITVYMMVLFAGEKSRSVGLRIIFFIYKPRL